MADPTSELSIPSSSSPPQNRHNAIFSSDVPAQPSSPPSSPPGFPWETSQRPSKSPQISAAMPPSPPITRTAFSVLGKRKALAPTDPNPRRAKKPSDPRPTISDVNDKRSRNRRSSNPAAKPTKTLTQLRISLGQTTRKTCQACGMEYVPSAAEDAALHARYHRQVLAGVPVARAFVARTEAKKKFPGWRRKPEMEDGKDARAGKGGKAEEGDGEESTEGEEDVVVRIDSRDAGPRRAKAQMVLETVQRELGAVPLDERAVWGEKGGSATETTEMRFWAYMYVRGNKCVGFLLVERVSEAFTVVDTEGSKALEGRESRDSGNRKKTSALEALQARKRAVDTARAELDRRPVELSETKVPVRLGVSRIWTLSACRGGQIATTLLDTAIRDAKLQNKTQIAFSQPTQAGARLARRWIGQTYGWCVYA